MSSRPTRTAVINRKPIQYHISLPGDDDYDMEEQEGKSDDERVASSGGEGHSSNHEQGLGDGIAMETATNNTIPGIVPATATATATKSTTSQLNGEPMTIHHDRAPSASSEESDGDDFIPESVDVIDEEEKEEEDVKPILNVGSKTMTPRGKQPPKTPTKKAPPPKTPTKTPTKRERSDSDSEDEDDDKKFSKSPRKSQQHSSTSTYKFQTSSAIRLAIVDDLIRTASLNFKNIAAVTGDEPSKVSKYWTQTYKNQLRAGVYAEAFGGAPKLPKGM